MKKAELKRVKMVVFGEEKEFSYKDMLQVILETPASPQSGTTIGEIRRSIRLLEILEKSDQFLELENSDFEHVVERVKNMRYSFNNKALLEFIEYFEKVGKDG